MMHIRDQELAFVRNSGIAVEDPAIDSFNLFIDFGAVHGLFADEQYANSALAYLKRTGEAEAYENLKTAIAFMSRLVHDNSYRMVSIDGLDELITNHMIRGVITPLVCTVRETIDWELRHAIMSIMSAIYDQRRQIFILPENLRRFSAIIYITDARMLTSYNAENDEYKKRYGSDSDNFAPRQDMYGLNRLSKNDWLSDSFRGDGLVAPELRDNWWQDIVDPDGRNGAFVKRDGTPTDYISVPIDQRQHLAFVLPVCEMSFQSLGVMANHLDMQSHDHKFGINVKRSMFSMLNLAIGAEIAESHNLNAITDTEAYAVKLAKIMQNKIEIALLTKVQKMRDMAVSAALNLHDNIMAQTPVTKMLNSFVRPDDFWAGASSMQFKQGYSQYADSLDVRRDQVLTSTQYVNTLS